MSESLRDVLPAGDKQDDLAARTSLEKWDRAWRALFGLNVVQVFFVEHELSARVYTLDGKHGYRVEHKRLFGPNALAGEKISTKPMEFSHKARRGEHHGRARLGPSDVLAVRAWAKVFIDQGQTPTWTQKANELGVSESTLRDIANRRTWSHL